MNSNLIRIFHLFMRQEIIVCKSENYIKNLFNNENFIVKGGNIDKDNIDDWKLSINYDNSEIIDYSNIKKITEILDDSLDKNIKKLLKVPLSLVEAKYKKREVL